MSVRTGKGDGGYTDLFLKKSVSKDHVVMKAMGDIDELVSYLGLVKVKSTGRKRKEVIEKIQRDLYGIASEIAAKKKYNKKIFSILKEADVQWIKKILFDLEDKIQIKGKFYLPSESEPAAHLDIARTVARRAERSVVELFSKEREKKRNLLIYLNCVSDVLFVLAREGKQEKRKNGSKKN